MACTNSCSKSCNGPFKNEAELADYVRPAEPHPLCYAVHECIHASLRASPKYARCGPHTWHHLKDGAHPIAFRSSHIGLSVSLVRSINQEDALADQTWYAYDSAMHVGTAPCHENAGVTRGSVCYPTTVALACSDMTQPACRMRPARFASPERELLRSRGSARHSPVSRSRSGPLPKAVPVVNASRRGRELWEIVNTRLVAMIRVRRAMQDG